MAPRSRTPATCVLHVVLFAAFTLACAGTAHAAHPAAFADSAAAWPAAAAAHRAGRWSLDFGIGSNFTLGSFKGTTLSATRATSAAGAWRVGLTYGVSAQNQTTSETTVTDTSVVGVNGSGDENQQLSLAVVILRLHRFHPARRIEAFYGVGPSVSWNRLHDERTQVSIGVGTAQVLNEYAHNVTIGIAGDLGVEAFVARDVSLHAQYGSVGGYSFARDVRRIQSVGVASGSPAGPLDERTQGSHGWSLNANNVRFGVSVYL